MASQQGGRAQRPQRRRGNRGHSSDLYIMCKLYCRHAGGAAGSVEVIIQCGQRQLFGADSFHKSATQRKAILRSPFEGLPVGPSSAGGR
jgi:hypothetical protein